ncbi:MAG: iron-containing alcohol dehydrogenase [Desulfarculaceae bacterium]|nr:iron-containing alcohol dehydrogenase [Desulfarculaceae bacterium]MCF8045958.1 iron-containing alcohol dehydrogenase [Desulfarculaceae bacterium]MCF8063687.1 iron-containing alcohol dehydrogenase [Desulfarculaceae bacterium]MCF8097592.1 iron-containing alcohol dehydrogenase [Desulfarculaceae bacterium]MCF8121161.1 iron-containing alcohol dehydrogenase [Desulfarculaceae bacterium]
MSPRQLMMGDGAAGQVEQLLAGWKITGGDVLLVADKEVVKLGLDRKVAEPLEAAGYKVAVFDGIVGEPTLEIAEALTELARQKPFKAVVGMGGGSSLDMSKLAAAFAVNQGKVTDYLGVTSFDKAPLPLINVPTTAGTGAEATAVSMLSVEGRKAIVLSPQLVPLATVLDAELTKTLPPKITAATGMDALSHALEAFMSVNASPYTDTQATTCMSIVAHWLKPAFEDGSNMEARRAMIYGAYLGGLTLNAGVVLGHSVAYTIANRCHLPHGVSCAMALPYTIAYNLKAIPERISQAADIVLGKHGSKPEELVTWVDELIAALGLPRSLKEVGISQSDVPAMIAECVERYPRPTNPAPIDADRLQVFYETIVTGDVARAVEYYQGG